MTLTVNELLQKSARALLAQQEPDGSMPPGHNGPYHDPETPVRTTAHSLFLFATLYQKTGDSRYRSAGEKAISYLFSPDARPSGKTFHFRNKAGKDKCNGLVGQAWVIEAFVKAAEAFDRQDCYELAEEVYLLHPWDKKTALWKPVEVDGKVLTYYTVFNQQLWFAAAGSLLKNNPSVTEQVHDFITRVAIHVHLYPDGTIFHLSPMGSLYHFFRNGPEAGTRELISRIQARRWYNEVYSKSVGYHGFNLYAFALLREAFPHEKIWKSERFKKLINAHNGAQFQKDLQESIFGYRYNVSGIEIAFAVETFFPQKKEESTIWIERQLKETYLDDYRPLERSAVDVHLSRARIYEAARLKGDYTVEIG